MNRRLAVRLAALATALLISITTQATAQNPWSSPSIRPEDLVVKLVTIAPGEELYAWWGHAGIVIEDRRSGHSRFYDYGRFSFRQEHFYTNFIKGRLLFEVGVVPTTAYLDHYRNLNRTVQIQTLRVAPERARALAVALEENIRPDNRVYLYDHYYDNCATRLRDLIDEYTDGALEESTRECSGLTFREITRKYTEHAPIMDFLLMYLMSDVIDGPMSMWETMFLPDMLMEVVDEVALATESVRFNTATGRRSIPESASPLVLPSLAGGLFVGLLAVAAMIASFTSRLRRSGMIAAGTIIAVCGFASGLLGTLLGFMSLFTDHVVTYGNENLLFTNPLSLGLVVSGILVAKRRRKALLVTGIISGTLFLAAAGNALLKPIIPALDQDNWPAIALFGANYLMLFSASIIGILHERKVSAGATRRRR